MPSSLAFSLHGAPSDAVTLSGVLVTADIANVTDGGAGVNDAGAAVTRAGGGEVVFSY